MSENIEELRKYARRIETVAEPELKEEEVYGDYITTLIEMCEVQHTLRDCARRLRSFCDKSTPHI